MSGSTLFSIGEALIDMIPSRAGCSFDEVPSFSPRTGGAPANVCAAFARLGGKSAFLSQLGDDPFGHKIARELADCGIDLSHLAFTDKASTALAFVSLEEDGSRTFSFYRKTLCGSALFSGADRPCMVRRCLCPALLQCLAGGQPHALRPPCGHLPPPGRPAASSALTRTCASRSGRTATCCAGRCCSSCRFPTSSKFRMKSWNFSPARRTLKPPCRSCSWVMCSWWSTPAAAAVPTPTPAPPMALPPCRKVRAVDTTGAGDGFIGSFLWQLERDGVTRNKLEKLSRARL